MARHNLAVLCREQSRDGEAESHWQGAVAEFPDYRPCWIGLAEMYLHQEGWSEFDSILEALERDPPTVETVVLRARAHLAQRDYAAARQAVERAIVRDPAALLPRVLLPHVLLQEHRDLPAAERALRDVLTLCPEHGEAQRNLAVLRRELDQP